MESLFLHEVYCKGGCRQVSYVCICCSGPNGSILHYGHSGAPNQRVIQEGDMALFDMGAEYHGYCSDITCSFPINGKFTIDQRSIYEIVLKAHDTVISTMKPGTLWTDMHRLAERVILEELIKKGLLKNEPLDNMLKVHLGSYFMPHGLGHLLGCDTHDVGGYPQGVERIQEPGIKKLRTGRVLKEGMFITVEPGVYFIPVLLKDLFEKPELNRFIVKEKLEKFVKFGGIRIESNIIVTKYGAENITNVPRSVEDIESWMTKK